MKLIKKIQLIQPRHIYAPPASKKKLGHIYLPTSLITVASILINSGIEVELIDENIRTDYVLNDIVGINLLGAPYIPVVNKFENKLNNIYNDDYALFIGGQIVNGLTERDFKQLFSKNTIDGNDISRISKFINQTYTIIKAKDTSLIPGFELISDHNLELYLNKEFSFYLSQGCKYSCTFCSAKRTRTVNGKKIIEKEEYRNIELALKDLEYLIIKALSYKIYKLQIYLSNLDLFQTPLKLIEFALGVENLLRRYNIKIEFRGLATVASFLKIHKNQKEIIHLLKRIGLVRVGYGIDGVTADVYKKTKKPQTAQMCLDAIKLTSEYSITPETLMVFGHNNKENEDSLNRALVFCKEMLEIYNSLPRPHICKDIVPGNDGWANEENKKVIEKFHNDVSLFQHLDFTALPSEITHPDTEFRKLVSEYYIKICELPESLTQYVKPVNKNLSHEEQLRITNFNEGRYDL